MENLKKILTFCEENKFYFGEGNPDAKILFIGKEIGSALDKDKQPDVPQIKEKAEKVINENLNNWKQHLQLGVSQYLENMEKLFREKPNRTWGSYQKILNGIMGRELKAKEFDFLNYCFITEFSQLPLPNSNHKANDKEFAEEKRQSINEREKLFEQPFFQNFPIVIMACGHYPRDFGFDIEKIFDVEWTKETKGEPRNYYNLHFGKSKDGKVKILIHTRQVSMDVTDELLSEIADLCKEFYV